MVRYCIKCKTPQDVAELSKLLGDFEKKRLQSLTNNPDNSITIILKNVSKKTGKYILDRSSNNSRKDNK